ncbi:MAG: hypothetical protein ACOY9D_03430 [Pseudomonadota bacterium]
MNHVEGGEVELLPAPDKLGVLFVCTADMRFLAAGEAIANNAESGDSS